MTTSTNTKFKCEFCEAESSLLHEDEGSICSECGAMSHPNETRWETGENMSQESGRSALSQFQISRQITNVAGLRPVDMYSKDCVKREITYIRKNSTKEIVFKFHDQICEILRVPNHIKECSTKRLHEAYQSSLFVNRLKAVKMILAGVCVYVQVREEGIPMTISYMSRVTRCPKSSFGNVFKELKEELNIQLRTLSFEDLVTSCCEMWNLDASVQKYMLELIPILRYSYETGMDAEKFLVPLAYISFMTTQIQSKTDMTLTNFCKKHKINIKRSNQTQCNTTIDVLTVLCQGLPWVTDIPRGSKGRPNVCFYIDDLLKYQSSTLNELVCKSVTPNDVSTDDCIQSPIQRNAALMENVEKVEKSKTRKRKRRTPEPENDTPILHDIHSETLCDEDLTEGEMKQYIRDENDVAKFKESIHKFDYSDSDSD